jgi:hypothetical protein
VNGTKERSELETRKDREKTERRKNEREKWARDKKREMSIN